MNLRRICIWVVSGKQKKYANIDKIEHIHWTNRRHSTFKYKI